MEILIGAGAVIVTGLSVWGGIRARRAWRKFKAKLEVLNSLALETLEEIQAAAKEGRHAAVSVNSAAQSMEVRADSVRRAVAAALTS